MLHTDTILLFKLIRSFFKNYPLKKSNCPLLKQKKKTENQSSLFLLNQSRDSRYEAKNNPRCIGCSKRDISFLFEKSIVDPETAVNRCNQGLDEVSFLTSQVVHDLWEVRDIHHNGHEGRYPTQNFHFFQTFSKPLSFLLNLIL